MKSHLQRWVLAGVWCLFCGMLQAAVFTSVPAGGNWSSPATWDQNLVPGPNDTVVIAGPGVVVLNASYSCSRLVVAPEGVLRAPNFNPSLIVSGGLLLQGEILPNPSGTRINLSLGGDISVSGNLTLGILNFNGSGQQLLQSAPGKVWVLNTFDQSNITQPLVALTGLMLSGTAVNLGGGVLQFPPEGATRLQLQGGSLANGTLEMNGGELECIQGARVLNNTTLSDTRLRGLAILVGNVWFEGLVVVVDTLENLFNYNVIVFVNGHLENRGVVRRTNQNLYFRLKGNLINDGPWSSSSLEFTGNGSQQIENTPGSYFAVGSFQALLQASPVVVVAGLELRNASMDFNGGTLIMSAGLPARLVLDNCQSQNILIQGQGAGVELKNGAFLFSNAILENTVLHGLVQLRGDVTFRGNTILQDTLINRWNYNANLVTQGHFVNDGVVMANNLMFYFRAQGSVHNNGIWKNNWLEFNGSGYQEISQTDGCYFEVQTVNVPLHASPVVASTGLSFKNASMNFLQGRLVMPAGARLSVTGNSLLSNVFVEGNGGELFQDGFALITGSVIENMTLTGKVRLYGNNTFKGHMVVEDTLTGRWNYSASLLVEDSLHNRGVIEAENLTFQISIMGDVRNDGIWRNHQLNLTGPGGQRLFQGESGSFQVPVIVAAANASPLLVPGNLSFSGCNVNLNYSTLELTAGETATLSFAGGTTFSAAIIKGNSGQLLMEGGGWIQNTTLENLVLQGVVICSGNNTFRGHLVVEGILINRFNYSATVLVEDSLVNLGQVLNANQNLTLNIKKNIRNKGVWTNNVVNLVGDAPQEIRCENGQWIGAAAFNHLSPAHPLVVKDSLGFSGSLVNLNGATLVMPQGGLLFLDAPSGKSFSGCTITGGDFRLEMPGGFVFLQAVEVIPNVVLDGVARVFHNVVFHKYLVVNGTLTNRPLYSVSLNVGGRITNNGNIANETGSLSIYCQGNLINNGTWENTLTQLNGSADQYVFLIRHQPINGKLQFLDASGQSPFQWQHNGAALAAGSFSGVSSNLLSWNVPVQQAWYGIYHCVSGAGPSRNFTVGGGLLADFRVLLEGPYTPAGMATHLNGAGLIPLTQPYNQHPWNYNGQESMDAVPNCDVVDWVLVELRETDGGPETATPATVTTRFAALLLSDGRIVQTDGQSELPFDLSITQNLFVVVRHRNHLAVMSAWPLTESQGIFHYDFSGSAMANYGGSNACKEVAPGRYAMIGGDGDANGQVQNQDKNNVWNPQSGLGGYLQGDFDLNGQVQNQDKNNIWNPNSGKGTMVP
jgi:hypothetical protein